MLYFSDLLQGSRSCLVFDTGPSKLRFPRGLPAATGAPSPTRPASLVLPEPRAAGAPAGPCTVIRSLRCLRGLPCGETAVSVVDQSSPESASWLPPSQAAGALVGHGTSPCFRSPTFQVGVTPAGSGAP